MDVHLLPGMLTSSDFFAGIFGGGRISGLAAERICASGHEFLTTGFQRLLNVF